ISGGAIATITMQYAQEFLRRGHKISVLSRTNGDPTHSAGELIPIEARERHELNIVQRALSKIRRKVERWDRAYYEWYMRSFVRALQKIKPAPDIVLLY